MKLFSAIALAAVLSAATQANAVDPNACLKEVTGVYQYISNGNNGDTNEERGASGLPFIAVIGCTEVLENVTAGLDVDGNPLEWKAGDLRCQYSEETFESDCNAIGYFRPEQITKIGGRCAWGYKEGASVEDNDGMVVLEGIFEGTPGACDFTLNAKFRGKGILQADGFNAMRFSDDGGITIYNSNFPRLGAPFK